MVYTAITLRDKRERRTDRIGLPSHGASCTILYIYRHLYYVAVLSLYNIGFIHRNHIMHL